MPRQEQLMAPNLFIKKKKLDKVFEYEKRHTYLDLLMTFVDLQSQMSFWET
jgi:hypothetical protein